MEPFVVGVGHHKPALPFDIHNEKLSHLQKCGYASLVDTISANKNKELNERILLNTTFTGDTGITSPPITQDSPINLPPPSIISAQHYKSINFTYVLS